VLLAWQWTSQFGVAGAALAWVPAIGISMLLCVAFLRSLLPRPFSGLLAPLLATGGASISGALVAGGLDRTVGGLPGLVLAGLAGGGVAVALLWWWDRGFSLGLSSALIAVFPQFRPVLDWQKVDR
jgi:hypothetical protein